MEEPRASSSGGVTAGVIRRLDDTVVNRIAAGEVIQRPANAIKEMMENSLDAKATNLSLVIGEGGLKLIQICDNGTGIRKEDLPIVCQRFTTSKLSAFEDLATIATFGFRGEALASISHVARLTLLTKTADSLCGFQAAFRDGELVGAPVSKAANQGTQITVEDLFYNVATRRKVLRSGAEEFQKVADVVTKYAVHNAGVAFSLKKSGESSPRVCTQKGASIRDNVAALYGSSLAKELLDVEKVGERCSIKALISNVNYTAAKKFNFLLFINHRLVESTALRKAIEMVYQAYLPKGSHPFVYLSLTMDPRNVDVNVHPTKHEVHFLHQDDVVEAVQREFDTQLLSSNKSRAYVVRQATVVPVHKMGEALASSPAGEAKPADKNLVRTDARDQKLDKFITVQKVSAPSTSCEAPATTSSSTVADVEMQEVASTSTAGAASASNPVWRDIRLTSICNLRARVVERGHEGLRNLIADHTYVGCVDQKWSLIQHSTKLYLADNVKVSRALFYQSVLKHFGNLSALRLSEPAPIRDLAMAALESEDCGWTEADGDKEQLAEYVVQCLTEKSEMLDDYFSMEIDSEGRLSTLPMVFEGHVPSFAALPIFLMRLATEVNWSSEEQCFDSFIREVARFYAIQANDPNARYDIKQHEEEASGGSDTTQREDPELPTWKWTMEHVIYAKAKTNLLHPPKAFAENMTFVQVADLPDLYKVFERC